MLRRLRTVQTPTVLASWKPGSAQTRAVQILVEGVDPRLVLVPQLWVTSDPSKSGENVCVQWSVFSVAEGLGGSKVPLRAVDGADARIIGPTLAARAIDNIVTAGDNLEINAATDLIIVAACNANAAPGPDTQKLWFRLDAYPAETSLRPEDYNGLLAEVKVQISNPGEVACASSE